MEVPENFKGMKKVKEYPNHVLYEKTIVDKWGEEHTVQIRDRKINAGLHL